MSDPYEFTEHVQCQPLEPPPLPSGNVSSGSPITGTTNEPASSSKAASGGASLIFTLPRVAALMILWMVLQYVVPYLLERYQYAAARGRQRAEYEVAAEGLKTLPLDGLSKAYQMVSQHVAPSVVHIDVRSDSDDISPASGITYPFGPQAPLNSGQGSGVIVDPAGTSSRTTMWSNKRIDPRLVKRRAKSASPRGGFRPDDGFGVAEGRGPIAGSGRLGRQ
jgi:hypothetical protein